MDNKSRTLERRRIPCTSIPRTCPVRPTVARECHPSLPRSNRHRERLLLHQTEAQRARFACIEYANFSQPDTLLLLETEAQRARFACIHIHTYICMYIYICTCVCIYMCVCVCGVYVYTHTHTHTHTHSHTHTHTHTPWARRPRRHLCKVLALGCFLHPFVRVFVHVLVRATNTCFIASRSRHRLPLGTHQEHIRSTLGTHWQRVEAGTGCHCIE